MRFFLLLLVAAFAAVSAFAPHKAIRTPTRAVSMKMDGAKMQNAVTAAMVPFLAPMASFAAEGTGRAFGIDDGRLVFAALFPSLIIFPLYLQWSKGQDRDDFFDGYEKRRNG